MNARELHDITKGLIDKQVDRICYGTDERQIVLRALDLLVAVEESGDGLVKELLNIYPKDSGYSDKGRRAAARIVAQDAVLRELKEERDAEREARRREEARGDGFRRERDSLKRHAEAMAKFLTIDVDGITCQDPNCEPCAMVKSYRRDHPKEEA